MKLTYKDLFAGQAMLKEVWDLELSPKLFMKLRRLDQTIGQEISLFEPERVKLIQRHPKFIKDGMFHLPQPGDEGFIEYLKDDNEVFGMKCEKNIEWINEDVGAVEKKIEESKDDIVGRSGKALLDLIEQLNKANNEQKVEPMPAKVE